VCSSDLHILPIYPFALVLAAGAAAELMAMRRYAAKGILAVLAIFWMFEFARAYPSNIAFFNQTVGGPRNGYKYLADSNIDWGQDLKGLKRWMDTNGVAHINLAYFGNAAPAYYHMNVTYLPDVPSVVPENVIESPRLPGYVAVSATVLDAVYSDRDFYKPLRDKEPVARIGNSIFVYWIDAPWW